MPFRTAALALGVLALGFVLLSAEFGAPERRHNRLRRAGVDDLRAHEGEEQRNRHKGSLSSHSNNVQPL